jgi:Spy/CpxP family protein refolding chaperone
MKNKLYALALLPVVGFMVLGATSAYAFGGEGVKERGMHRGGHYGARLMTQEMREEFRTKFEALSDEEKETLHEERKEKREEMREEMEAFTGLTKEEMRELHRNGERVGDVLIDNGISKEDAEEFLTEQANERVDDMVERHDLDSDEEDTLRNRIADFVNRILDRWF